MEGFSGVRYCLPIRGNCQLESEARLQVGLIEAGKCKMRPGRHEQGIHEVGTAIE